MLPALLTSPSCCASVDCRSDVQVSLLNNDYHLNRVDQHTHLRLYRVRLTVVPGQEAVNRNIRQGLAAWLNQDVATTWLLPGLFRAIKDVGRL
jgi:hypothetical protein